MIKEEMKYKAYLVHNFRTIPQLEDFQKKRKTILK